MTTNIGRNGNGGRPRVIDNEQFFQATSLALFQHGTARLTLEVVAREVGCSAAALSRRFGSKQALLKAYLEWTYDNMRERFAVAHRTHSSPLIALRERLKIPIEERLEEFGTFTDWYGMAQDPVLKQAVNDIKNLWVEEITESLRKARAAGELVECDIDRLGHNLAAALAGATCVWSSPDVHSLPDELVAVADSMVAPFRTPPTPSLQSGDAGLERRTST